MDVCFLGTGDCGVPILDALIKSRHTVKLVVTGADVQKGRGRKLSENNIKKFASENALNVHQCDSFDDETIEKILASRVDVIVTVSFGKRIPESVYEYPLLGAYNIHFSILPKYRGPAPVAHAILNGETETGITIFKIEKHFDTGKVILQKKVEIKSDETTYELEKRLSYISSELILQALELLESKNFQLVEQDKKNVSYAPILKKKDGKIEWSKSAVEIKNLVRAMNPWPCAFSFIWCESKKRMIKVDFLKVAISEKIELFEGVPGRISQIDKNFILIEAKDKFVSPLELKPENSRIMDCRSFVNGYRVRIGDRFFSGG